MNAAVRSVVRTCAFHSIECYGIYRGYEGMIDGDFVQSPSISLSEYRVHMIKIQKLMLDAFGVEARSKDVTANLTELVGSLGDALAAEND